MYESFFGLSRRPFPATPDPHCLHETPAFREVRNSVRRSVEEGRGITLLTAGPGLGKTLFCQVLREDLKADWTALLLDRSSLRSRRGLLHAILDAVTDTGPLQHAKELELRLHIHFAVRQGRYQGGGIVVIVDEAETAHPETLDELAALANPGNHPPLLRIVLAGRPEVFQTMSRPECQAITQCIASRFEIKPMSLEESRAYISERIRQAGRAVESVFTEEAFNLAARAGGGNPRAINQLCDHSLLLAYISDDKPLKAMLVRDALHDLQSLPAQTGPFLPETSREPKPAAPIAPPPAEPLNRQPESTVAPRLVAPAVSNPAEDSSLTTSISSPTGAAGLPPTETGVYEVGAGIPSKNASPWFQLLPRPPEPVTRLPETTSLPPGPKEPQVMKATLPPARTVRLSGARWEPVLDRYARLEAGLPIPAGCPRSVQPTGMPREFHPSAWHVGKLTDWESWQRPAEEELISDPWVSQPALTPRIETAPWRLAIAAPESDSAAPVEKVERLRVFTAESDDLTTEAGEIDPTRYLLQNLPSEQFYRSLDSTESSTRNQLLGSPMPPDQLLEGLIPLVDEVAQDYQPVQVELPVTPMVEPEQVQEPESVEEAETRLEQPLIQSYPEVAPELPEETKNPSPAERKRGRFSQLFTRLRQRAFGQE